MAIADEQPGHEQVAGDAGMIKRLAFATFLLCVLAACGNKGPLVMPDAPADLPAPPADTPAPATTPENSSGTPASRR